MDDLAILYISLTPRCPWIRELTNRPVENDVAYFTLENPAVININIINQCYNRRIAAFSIVGMTQTIYYYVAYI